MATNTAQWPPAPQPSANAIDLTKEEDFSSDSVASDEEAERSSKRQKIAPGSFISAAPGIGGPNGIVNGYATAPSGGLQTNGGAYRAPQVLNQPPLPANFNMTLGPPLNQPTSQFSAPLRSYASTPSLAAYSPTPASGMSTPGINATPGPYFGRPTAPLSLTAHDLPPSYAPAAIGNALPQQKSVIDLTNSDTPSPPTGSSVVPAIDPKKKDARKDVVCIGELTVTALVLYPIDYLVASPNSPAREEWVPVRLMYDGAGKKRSRVNEETIRITSPVIKGVDGQPAGSDDFGVVEQRVANVLGPLMAKVLIRVTATIRRAAPNSPILSLRILIFTPKGNVNAVSSFLQNASLLLDHPSIPYNPSDHRDSPLYQNPHNPPPGGFRSQVAAGYGAAGPGRWSQATVAGKSVEVQRNQVDEVFASLRSGDDLPETEPGPNVATRLYPHQKKALTFILEREQEIEAKGSSLWQPRKDPAGRIRSWHNVVTQKEVREKPIECKGAILADDMGLGKTISVVSLIAQTLGSASAYVGTVPIRATAPPPPPKPIANKSDPLTAARFAGSVWGMPDVSDDEEEQKPVREELPPPTVVTGLSAKARSKLKSQEQKSAEELARAARIKCRSRASLIVCPLSTVVNWEDQFKEHWAGEVIIVGGASGVPLPPTPSAAATPSAGTWAGTGVGGSLSRGFPSSSQIATGGKQGTNPLKVYVYHGTSRRPDPNYLADFDAVITTYSTLASEYSRQQKSLAAQGGGADKKPAEEEEDDGDDYDDDDDDGSSDGVAEVDMYGREIPKEKKRKNLKRKKAGGSSVPSGVATPVNEVSSPLQQVNWFRVVLDEAHSIKEITTIGSRACCDLVADRRLCLTGTPVQNKLDDVFALLKFLRFEPFDDKGIWNEYIGGPAKFGQPLGVARLQTIMKAITLRRTKETRSPNGKKILDLPPRRDELRFLKFDDHEKKIYASFFDESKAEFTQLSKNNEVMKNYVGILQKILRLRQICDHWELVQGKGPNAMISEDSGLTYDEVTAAIQNEGLNLSRATAIFALLKESGTAICTDCTQELALQPGQNAEDTLEEEVPKQSKRGRKPKNTMSRAGTRQNSPVNDKIPRPVVTRCQHLFCLQCFRLSISPDWPNVHPDLQMPCSICQTMLKLSVDAVEVSPDGLLGSEKNKPTKRREKRPKGENPDFKPSTKVKALLQDLLPFSRSNPYSGNYDPNSIEVTMCDAQGNAVDDGVVKTVVFSQWTSMLDKIEDALEAAGIRYDRLDGTMKRDDRTRAMEALKKDPRCEVLLVSLRAGGVGLNLTAARRVYLMDPYWNPAVENQAVDRIHRLGQVNPVTTIKFVMEDSIETRLLEVQKRKTQLANMTLGQTLSKAEVHQRRLEELNQLFGEGPGVEAT